MDKFMVADSIADGVRNVEVILAIDPDIALKEYALKFLLPVAAAQRDRFISRTLYVAKVGVDCWYSSVVTLKCRADITVEQLRQARTAEEEKESREELRDKLTKETAARLKAERDLSETLHRLVQMRNEKDEAVLEVHALRERIKSMDVGLNVAENGLADARRMAKGG